MPDSHPLQRHDLVDLDTELANGLIRELMEIEEGGTFWASDDWVTERAILNRIFRMGQQCARDTLAASAGKD